MNIPKGATHKATDNRCISTGGLQYYRFDGTKWAFWTETASPHKWAECRGPCVKVTPIEQTALREKTVQAIADVLSSTVSRDTRQQAAEALYDAGYRKFEIVEDDI